MGTGHRLAAGTLTLAAALIVPLAAGADGGIRNAWKSSHPSACELLRTAADNCVLCHTDPPDLNPYGTDVAGIGTNFAAIDNVDSDHDGRTNAQEYGDCTLPGDSTSLPADPDSWGLIKQLYR